MVAPHRHNVVLTGFMGTGKSTVGRALADRLDLTFVDTDSEIEAEHGPIPEIFATQGEDAFRAIERDIANELAQRHGVVIATGGRMLLDEANADALGATGVIFCLTATLEDLLARLLVADDQAARPLLDTEHPERRVTELLDERAEGYAQFDQVSTTGRTVEQIVEEIASRIVEQTS